MALDSTRDLHRPAHVDLACLADVLVKRHSTIKLATPKEGVAQGVDGV